MKILKKFNYDVINIIIIMLIVLLGEVFIGIKSGNFIIAFNDGVNTDIYSQVILLICAIYIENIARMWIEEYREKNLWVSLFFNILISVLVAIGGFKFIESRFILTILLDIVILMISVSLSQFIVRLIRDRAIVNANIEDIFKYINLFIMGITLLAMIIM